ncbi:MAG: sugar phosphate nucleotidyltransferase [Alphaproteobacteria bacterium]|nr:sugar phosphate nucleotidyltransferase [Alphaproteobacteria bacterium]
MYKKQKITQAIILAAGFGVRMRPLTLTTPKPLVKLKNKPLIFYILEELKKNKIKKCFINVHYLSLKIKKYIDEYKKTNQTMEIIIIKEEVILDTGGAIKNIINKDNSQPTIVINADSLIVPFKSISPLSLLIDNFDSKNMDFLLLLDNFKDSIGYHGKGDFSFSNKNNPSTIIRNMNKGLAYTGWQILNPNAVNQVINNVFSLNYCYDKAIKENLIWGIINTHKWLHIGTIEALNEANTWLENYK